MNTLVDPLSRLGLAVCLCLVACRQTNQPPLDPTRPSGPSSSMLDYPSVYSTSTTDPDGDSIAYRFTWGDGETTHWSTYFPEGSTLAMSHGWRNAGSYPVKAQATDRSGAISEWSEPTLVDVAGRREVLWNALLPAEPFSSPLILEDGAEFVVVVASEESLISVGLDGITRNSCAPRWHDGGFTSDPVYCRATGNIILGTDDELCAYTPELDLAWHWPGDSILDLFWGSPAVRDNRVYVASEGEWGDVLRYFLDLGSEACLMNSYYLDDEAILDSPVIDPSGSVLFCTDAGYLCKLAPDIDSVIWRVQVADMEAYGAAVDDDGVTYVGSDALGLVAVTPDGEIKWTYHTGDGPGRPAVGDGRVYVGNWNGRLMALDVDDGLEVWSVNLAIPDWGEPAVDACPLLTSDGLLYVVAEDRLLFCVDRDEGLVLWYCQCDTRARTDRDSEDTPPSPTIAPDGNIIVTVWEDFLSCVPGYPGAQLADTPWPKWQRDYYNTGCARP